MPICGAIYQTGCSGGGGSVGGVSRLRYVADVEPNSIPTGTNVTGVAPGANLTTPLGDYSSLDFIEEVSVILNGQVLHMGTGVGDNCDVYPGDNPANGDLKFKMPLRGGSKPDIIMMELYEVL